MPLNILSIDDSTDYQEMIQKYFIREECNIETVLDFKSAQELLKNETPDIILLDLLLPDTNGLDALKILQTEYPQIPIIMISGRAEEIDRVIGIEAGADDYISKPFMTRELYARIRAVLKRTRAVAGGPEEANKQPEKPQFGPWTLDATQFQVIDEQGNSAGLTTTEFLLLQKLFEAKNCVISRDQLFEALDKSYSDVYDRSVDVAITRLRKKLGDTPKNPKYIKTIRNVGYMFMHENSA